MSVLAIVGAIAWNCTPDLYTIRVSVLNQQDSPVGSAEIQSTAGGEILRDASGWQLKVPAKSLPAGRRITLRALVPAEFLQGQQEVLLASNPILTATIRLEHPTGARVRGVVIDSHQQALAGVRVSATGCPESVVTGEDGTFSLPAHAAEGQQVELRLEKPGSAARIKPRS